jgi:hypothetical protein
MNRGGILFLRHKGDKGFVQLGETVSATTSHGSENIHNVLFYQRPSYSQKSASETIRSGGPVARSVFDRSPDLLFLEFHIKESKIVPLNAKSFEVYAEITVCRRAEQLFVVFRKRCLDLWLLD